MARASSVLAAVMLCLVFAGGTPAWSVNAEEELDYGPFVPGELLVRWQSEASHEALATIGGVVLEEVGPGPVELIHVAEGLETRSVAALAVDPSVVWAQPNYVRRADSTPNDPRFRDQWGLQRIQAPTAWDITTGVASVVVAVLDTGVDLDHPDLRDRLVPGYNFFQPDELPMDDSGHGTHVAGTIAATANNSTGIAGVASGVSIMPIKVLNSRGAGRDSRVAQGIRWAVDHGANIVNMSFGGQDISPVLSEAVEYASSSGVVLVVAAGNEGGSEPNYPGATDSAIAVAATNSRDRRAMFSNYGSWVDIAAPGTQIVSTYWDGASTYRAGTGTSMATPHVTGVIALMLSLKPGLSPAEVEEILKANADPLPDDDVGSGRVNAARVLASIRSSVPPAVPEGLLLQTYEAPLLGRVVYVPMVLSDANGWRTVLLVQNPSDRAVAASVLWVSVDGALLGSAQVPLPANGIAVTGPPTAPIGWRGSAVISADVPIAALAAMSRGGGSSVGIPASAAGGPTAGVSLVFKDREGLTTTIAVQNLAGVPAVVDLAYTGGDGRSVSGGRATIGPLAAHYVNLGGIADLPSGFSGSVTARSTNGQPLAIAALAINSTGAASAQSGISARSAVLAAPKVVRSVGGATTEIQVRNHGGAAANVTISYFGSSGGLAGSDTVTIEPGALRLLSAGTVAGLADSFDGVAVIRSTNGQPITAVVRTTQN
ncbi:MAG: peptidase and subtilisin kexin sedolisin [Chloroflexi bacterium]|nr:peptidase and subtilisin kexin sedolisin [Chloroflexota bacterium]